MLNDPGPYVRSELREELFALVDILAGKSLEFLGVGIDHQYLSFELWKEGIARDAFVPTSTLPFPI